MSEVIIELETLRRAHAELQCQHAAVVEDHNKLGQGYLKLEQNYVALEQARKRLEQDNDLLRAALKAARKRIFGRRSEKLDAMQYELFEEASGELDAEVSQELAETAAAEAEQAKKKRKRRRRRITAGLPRERRVHQLPEHERICDGCQAAMQPFGEEVSEELEYVPAVLRVIEHVSIKYSCPHCHEAVVTAAAPERPIPRVIAGAGLLAHLAVSKFSYHLPLYRQEQMFAIQGAEISRKAMCGWLGASAELLEPIVEEMKRELLTEPLIQSDDTVIRYQDHSRLGTTGRGYLWAYSKPWEEVVFEFRTDRSRAGPLGFLAGYHGAVQVDGYAGYNELFRQDGIVHVGCMAHVRRKIYESRGEHPEWAELLLAGIQRLYRIERRARRDGITGKDLRELRGAEPRRILGVLGQAMEDLREQVLPKSGFGRALAYALNQWPSIQRYTEIAEAELDNNGVENAIRPVALGRRNWLFAGSQSGGQRAATLYSLITTCKRLEVEPCAYLTDVIARIGTHKVSRIGELTPRAWKAAQV